MEINLPDIIEGCKRNDQRAQEHLYRLCYPEMIRICQRYAFGDADAAGLIFNTAMLKVFKNIGQFKGEGVFLGWVRKVIVNSSVDYCRSRSRFKSVDTNGAAEFILPVVPVVYEKLSAAEILKLVNTLPKNTGFVFNLFVMEGFKHEEIAGMLGISSGTSKWHLNEARRLMKEKIESLYKRENLANAI